MFSRIQMVFWLDLTLLVLMCAVQSVTFTGLSLHEWMAITIIGMIVVHLLLSWTWIDASSRRLASAKAHRMRINYFLNACLFASATTVICSGLAISEVALPALGLKTVAGDIQWRYLHNRASNWVLIFAGLHLAINWDWSVAAAKKCLRLPKP